ncbi:MAG: (Fe-S)-binding protein [Nitrospinota bacterium]|nr:(Fe-S)-binding protein [Nitrospinota bacterium]
MIKKAISAELADWTGVNLKNCFGADECLKACPVADPSLTIAELNETTMPETLLTPKTAAFAAECIQCGRCDAACPAQAGRSVMMLSLKEKMVWEGKAPESHNRYFQLKGPDKSAFKREAFNGIMKTRWRLSASERIKSEKLAAHIDKEDFRKAEFLLYFGCYIFTKQLSAAHTVEIAEKLGLDFEVMGGLKSCCGWPQLLGGRTRDAENYHLFLFEMIQRSSPAYVVTGCAECFMALCKIKQKYNPAFTPLTTSMWLNMFSDKLRLKRGSAPVTFHDSCHISRKAKMPEPARELLAKMNPLVEMKRSGPMDTFCCGYWGLKSNPEQLKALQADRLREAADTGANTMVVECLSCLESFSDAQASSGVRVVDILSLARERMGR